MKGFATHLRNVPASTHPGASTPTAVHSPVRTCHSFRQQGKRKERKRRERKRAGLVALLDQQLTGVEHKGKAPWTIFEESTRLAASARTATTGPPLYTETHT